ncbi:MAG: A24 family peptidase [Tepidisphaeraceae bacterium]
MSLPDSTVSLPPDNISWIAVWLGIISVALAGATIAVLGGRDASLLPTLCLVLCLLATSFDAATSRIPNQLTYTAILLGLIANILPVAVRLATPGLKLGFLAAVGPAQSLLGMLACATIGLGCMTLAGMGGGDMKLLAAIGAILGFSAAMGVLFWTLVVGVVYALMNLVVGGRLNATLGGVTLDLLNLLYLRQVPAPQAATTRVIPLAVPLLIALPVSRFSHAQHFLAWLAGGT